MKIERFSPESHAVHISGELIQNWQVGRIHPTPACVPDGWTLVRLTSVATLESGHTPSRNQKSYWDGGNIQWVSLHDSQSLDGPVIARTAQAVTAEGIQYSSARLLPEGTVVFSRTATVGKSTIMATAMATSQDFANFICGPKLHNRYLMYLFRFMAPEWNRLMAGSTHNTIYMPTFEALQILLPPILEQKAIAEALGDADALIEALGQILAKKRDLKQGAMQELLTGKRRLPGFGASGKFRRTESGLIPADWKYEPLTGYLRRQPKYGINAAASPFNFLYPTYLRITDITDDGRFLDDNKTSVQHPAAESYFLEAGDIVFARTGASVGKSYIYNSADGPLVFAGFLIRLSPDAERLAPKYLFYFAQSATYWN